MGRIHRQRISGGGITSDQIEFAPFIAPDESFIVFTYSNRDEHNGLHVSFRQDDSTWLNPVSMRPLTDIGSLQRFASLSPDGKYLFFCAVANRRTQAYWVDASVIETFRPH